MFFVIFRNFSSREFFHFFLYLHSILTNLNNYLEQLFFKNTKEKLLLHQLSYSFLVQLTIDFSKEKIVFFKENKIPNLFS